VGRIHHQRGKHRVDALAEQLAEVVAFAARQFLPAQDLDPVLGQFGVNPLAEHPGVPDGQLSRQLQRVLQYLAGQPNAGALDREAGHHPAHQPGHPDHEELVQVVREDGQEPHPLE
jgi:hypothetical protein